MQAVSARRAGVDVAENDQVDRRRHLGNGVSQAQDDAARGQVLAVCVIAVAGLVPPALYQRLALLQRCRIAMQMQ